jgi:hypothetical protein
MIFVVGRRPRPPTRSWCTRRYTNRKRYPKNVGGDFDESRRWRDRIELVSLQRVFWVDKSAAGKPRLLGAYEIITQQ